MTWLTVFFLTLASSGAFAAFNEALTLKQVSDDGNTFIFVRKEGPAPWNGISIKDPQTKAILIEAKVTKCSATSCMGQVVRNRGGLRLRTDESYVHSYNETPIKWEPKDSELLKPRPVPDQPVTPEPIPEPILEPAPGPEPVAPKPKPVAPVAKKKQKEKPKAKKKERDPATMSSAWYLSFGSPVGPGFKTGYYNKNDWGWLGYNYANISSTTNNVSIKGHLLSASGAYHLFRPDKIFEINGVAELGIAKVALDFSAVDGLGPKEDETTYFLAAAGEAKLDLGRWMLALKSGFSKTGLKSSYRNVYAEYNNPYGTILVFLEIGAFYRF